MAARYEAGILDRVRALHAEGLPDRVIGERLGLNREQAKRLRHRCGLKSNRDIEGQRRSVKAQQETLGIGAGGDLRALAFRRFAVSRGWPEDLAPRCVQILDLLAAFQPMTRPQIAERCGIDWKGMKRSMKSVTEGGSYLATLMRRGLVTYQRRSQPSGRLGIGRLPGLYWLTAAAMEMVTKRLKPKGVSNGQASQSDKHPGHDSERPGHRRTNRAGSSGRGVGH